MGITGVGAGGGPEPGGSPVAVPQGWCGAGRGAKYAYPGPTGEWGGAGMANTGSGGGGGGEIYGEGGGDDTGGHAIGGAGGAGIVLIAY